MRKYLTYIYIPRARYLYNHERAYRKRRIWFWSSCLGESEHPHPPPKSSNPCITTTTCLKFKHTCKDQTYPHLLSTVRLVWWLLEGACHMQFLTVLLSVGLSVFRPPHLPVGIDLVIILFVLYYLRTLRDKWAVVVWIWTNSGHSTGARPLLPVVNQLTSPHFTRLHLYYNPSTLLHFIPHPSSSLTRLASLPSLSIHTWLDMSSSSSLKPGPRTGRDLPSTCCTFPNRHLTSHSPLKTDPPPFFSASTSAAMGSFLPSSI